MKLLIILAAMSATIVPVSARDNPPRNSRSLGECAPGVHQERAAERDADRDAGIHVTGNNTYVQDYHCLLVDDRWLWIDPSER